LHRIRSPSSHSAARVDRASEGLRLHRQHFARSSYRCGIRLTGSCNSIFKDEHPNPGRLLRPRSQSELCISRRAAHFGDRCAQAGRRFLPLRSVAPLTSDVPLPLPRRRVNDAGFNASSGHLRSAPAAASPPLTFASTGLARSLPPSAATDDALERTRQHSPTFCNRSKARAHWRTIVTRRAPSLFTTRRCTLRCPGDAKPHRPSRSGVSAVQDTEAGSDP
jgi:hypothetical protein